MRVILMSLPVLLSLSLSTALFLLLSAVSLAVRVLTSLLGGQEGGGGGGVAMVVAYQHVLGRALHTTLAALRKTKQNSAFTTGLGACCDMT